MASDPTETAHAQTEPRDRPPVFGERLPSIRAAATSNGPNFSLDLLAGRYTLFCAYGSATHPAAQDALGKLAEAGHLFHADQRVLAAISNDARDRDEPVFEALSRNCLMIWDADRQVVRTWGLLTENGQGLRACWMLVDPGFRVMAVWPLDQGSEAIAAFESLGAPNDHAEVPLHAPVLIVPRVFEPQFCARLMAYYDETGGQESGVTRERDGKTIVELAPQSKRRKDCMIEDEELRAAAMRRIYYRLAPEIQKAFNFMPTRMERYLIGRYDAGGAGFFKPHRDNTTKGTAHRRFAISINLNHGDYIGGELIFREFGLKRYRPPAGGALVFGCSLMHEVTPVLKGSRYAFLPFLYDDAAAAIREANNDYLDQSVGQYRPDGRPAANHPAGPEGGQTGATPEPQDERVPQRFVAAG
jgi:predicted 2-oxoglutarate/Fe(II)-dependent dioxygenase YbiX/peroxiredoxin